MSDNKCLRQVELYRDLPLTECAVEATPVPIPATLPLVLIGMVVLLAFRKLRRRGQR